MGKLNPTTPLEHAVNDWYKEKAEDGYTDCLADLAQQGCQSGMVSDLIYYRDTTAFYLKHKKEIWRLLDELLDDTGLERTQDLLRDWDGSDRWAEETPNQNLLAWFGFEETARNLAGAAGIDI
jgi:hypothetical protein